MNPEQARRVVSLILVVAAAMAVGCDGPPTMQADPQMACIDASSALMGGTESEDPEARADAVAALAEVAGKRAGPVLTETLDDESPLVRWRAAMAIGQVRYEPARDTLIAMAAEDEPDKRVYTGVLYALYRLGETEYAGPLGELLFDTEPQVRQHAAQAMGEMGEPSATGPLKMLLADEQDQRVQLAVTVALAKLAEQRSQTRLEAYTKVSDLQNRLVAIRGLVDAEAPRAELVLRDLTNPRQSLPVRLAAGAALARLGQAGEDDYELSLRAAREPGELLNEVYQGRRQVDPAEIAELRRLAAYALGYMNRKPAVDALMGLIRGGDPRVRVAAATSIIRILGCRNLAVPTARTQPAEDLQAAGADDERPDPPELHTAGSKD